MTSVRKPRRRRARSAAEKIYRKKPVQARSQTTVDGILVAAAEILARTGYDRFTTNHVARAAGVSVGSLYQYFPSKEALVAALLDRHVDGSGDRFRRQMKELEEPSLARVMRCWVESMIDAHRDSPQLHRVFVEELPRKGSFVAKSQARIALGIAMMRAYLAEHAAEIAPQNHDLSAFMLVHTVDALTHAAVVSRPELLDGSELAAEITMLVLSYLEHGAAPDALPATKARARRQALGS